MLRSLTKNITLFAKAAIGKGNESFQDENDIMLMEQEVKDAKNFIAEQEDKLIDARTTVAMKHRELDGYRERRENLEKDRSQFRVDYDKAIEAGDEELAEKCKGFAIKIKQKLAELDAEYKPQIESHEMSAQIVEELEATIDEKRKEIERAETEVKTARERQAIIDLHEKTASVTDGIDGINLDNSALSRMKKRQEAAQEKINQRNLRKKAKGTSLEDEIAQFRASETEDDPWA